jgi:hypothetical protein
VCALELATSGGSERLQLAATRLAERYSVESLATMKSDEAGTVLAAECPELVRLLDGLSTALAANGLAAAREIPTTSDALLVLMCQYIGELDAATADAF